MAASLDSGSRLCVTCKHLEYEGISEWQSDESGGTEGGYSCKKGHFMEVQPYDIKDFRDLIARAKKCAEYDDTE